MTEQQGFRIRIKVRSYEMDTLGHLNQAVYHSYAEVARMEALEKAAGKPGALEELGVGSVLLETQISYRRELRGGDEVDVTTEAKFGSGKTFQITHDIIKADGTLSAELTCTLGLMDLTRRKLVEDPRGWFERAGFDLGVLSAR